MNFWSKSVSQNVGIKNLNDWNAFIECSDRMDDLDQIIDDYNLSRKKKNLNCVWWHDGRYYE